MKFLWQVIACVVVAYGLALALGISANPEVRFWSHVDEVRDREIAETRSTRPDQPVIFFTGGSSCAFSIDPRIIEETCGMPAFNLGLPVAAGGGYLLHQALEKARSGDVLVVCLEPDLLTSTRVGFGGSAFSFGMACVNGQPAAASGGRSLEIPVGLRDYLTFARPGPRFVATWLAKQVTGRGYRYTTDDMRYHGRLETPVSDPHISRVQAKLDTTITPLAHRHLARFRRSADAKGVRLVYSMPWMLTEPGAADHNRDANRRILESIDPVIPTIDDGYQGVAVDPAHFADSGLHLTAEGSSLRSQGLADALHRWLNERQ